MIRRYGKVAAGFTTIAASLLVAVLLLWGLIPHRASAAEIMAQAIEAISHLQSVYMKVNIRTLPRDNFEYIGLDRDFVPHELWEQFTDPPKWRIEKPGRVVVMDGTQMKMLIRPNMAVKGRPGSGLVQWLRCLLTPDRLLDAQMQSSQQNNWPVTIAYEVGQDAREKILLTVEAKAQGDYAKDWTKNKSISDSDNRRVYHFDAETKLLEGLQVYVHKPDKDVLVLDVVQIEYNKPIDPAVFDLKLPDDVHWYQPPQVLPDNWRYEQMSPEQTARAFFQAMSGGDWDEVDKLAQGMQLPQKTKDYLTGLEIISIGTAFKSGQYPGLFVPYEIRFRDGHTKKFNLAVRNDNPAKRYVVDGGF